MQGGFIWDDDAHVTQNPCLRTGEGLYRIWFEPGAVQQYYPLTYTVFWLEYHLWHLQPFGYHLVNLLLHAFNAILLWRVLGWLVIPRAWFAAAIFALHPVHVESVAWISELKNVLSGFFYLAAILAYIRFAGLDLDHRDDHAVAESPSSKSNDGRWRFYITALSLFLCALLSKTITCSLPVAILLLLWWKRDRLVWREMAPLLPFFILGAALGLATPWIEKRHYIDVGGSPDWTLSLLDRCLIAGRALCFYAAKLFWPDKLTFIYPRWQIDVGIWWQYLFPFAVLIVLIILWFFRRKIGKAPLVAVAFSIMTLAPALGFFDIYPMRYTFVADHYQYLASTGLIGLFCVMMSIGFRWCGRRQKSAESIAWSALLFILGMLVWRQGHVYKDVETLWKDTVTKNPGCWLAHDHLGVMLLRTGQLEKAGQRFSRALQLNPGYREAHHNLGIVLLQQGKIEEAIIRFTTALKLRPNFPEAHSDLAVALYRQATSTSSGLVPNGVEGQGKLEEAIEHLFEAMRLAPDYADARNNLAVLLMEQGKILAEQNQLEQATLRFRKALRLKPDFPEARARLEAALIQQEIFESHKQGRPPKT